MLFCYSGIWTLLRPPSKFSLFLVVLTIVKVKHQKKKKKKKTTSQKLQMDKLHY
jgi:hypothetical protein